MPRRKAELEIVNLEDLRKMQRAKKQMKSILKGLRTWITRRNKIMRKAGIKNPEDYPWGWSPDGKPF